MYVIFIILYIYLAIHKVHEGYNSIAFDNIVLIVCIIVSVC